MYGGHGGIRHDDYAIMSRSGASRRVRCRGHVGSRIDDVAGVSGDASPSTRHHAAQSRGGTARTRADGDADARRELVDVVYGSLAGHGPDDPTMLTVSTFLASGGSLETTARTLNVHPNTVRYRLKRAADTTGWDASNPRDAYVLATAIALGRIARPVR